MACASAYVFAPVYAGRGRGKRRGEERRRRRRGGGCEGALSGGVLRGVRRSADDGRSGRDRDERASAARGRARGRRREREARRASRGHRGRGARDAPWAVHVDESRRGSSVRQQPTRVARASSRPPRSSLPRARLDIMPLMNVRRPRARAPRHSRPAGASASTRSSVPPAVASADRARLRPVARMRALKTVVAATAVGQPPWRRAARGGALRVRGRVLDLKHPGSCVPSPGTATSSTSPARTAFGCVNETQSALEPRGSR